VGSDARISPIILPGHKVRVRQGQPGYVVIESKDHDPRVSFVFDVTQALDVADEIRLVAVGATETTAEAPSVKDEGRLPSAETKPAAEWTVYDQRWYALRDKLAAVFRRIIDIPGSTERRALDCADYAMKQIVPRTPAPRLSELGHSTGARTHNQDEPLTFFAWASQYTWKSFADGWVGFTERETVYVGPPSA